MIMLDIGPATFGHALLLPKNHYANVFEMPEELLAKAVCLAKTWGEKLVKALDADGLNLFRIMVLRQGRQYFIIICT